MSATLPSEMPGQLAQRHDGTDRYSPFRQIGMRTRGVELATRMKNSALTLARFKSDDPEGAVYKSLESQDAYLAILQISDLHQHDFWSGGRHENRGLFGKTEFNLIDLNAPSACRIAGQFEYIQVHVPRFALDDIASDADSNRITGLNIPREWKAHDPIVDHFKGLLLNIFDQPQKGNGLFVDHIVLALHAHLACAYGGMRPGGRRAGGLAPWQERRTKELLAADISRDVPMADLAAACGLSASHFARSFKISTGSTPHEWRQLYRVDRAKELLAGRDTSLAEIAVLCGFADQSHFTRIFGRLAGCTPRTWRRERGFR